MLSTVASSLFPGAVVKKIIGEGAMFPQIKAPNGLGYRGLSPPQPISGLGPAGNAFWHILKATERSILHLYADALS